MLKEIENIITVLVVLEEAVILSDVPSAIAVMMGLFCPFHLKELKYTFEVIHRGFITIGGRQGSFLVHSLRNRLFRCES